MKKPVVLSCITVTATIISLFSLENTYGAAAPCASYSFEGNYGDAAAVEREMYYSDDGLVESDGASFTYSDGPLGQCIHMTGAEGLKLNVKLSSESYTISYWLRPDRITVCTPTVMITPGYFTDEKFINVTLAADNISPNVWTHMVTPYDERNSTGLPGLLSPNEWVHITMVVDENMSEELLSQYGTSVNEYTSGVSLYINGYLTAVGRVPKNICTDSSNYWFGINIWDDLYSGYVDELYFYNEALSEDDIKALYIETGGNPDAEAPSNAARPDHNNFGGGSFQDDYVELEQGTISGAYNHLNMDNAAPIATQGVDNTTNAYSETALLAAIGFFLLAIGLILQYIKQKNNSYC